MLWRALVFTSFLYPLSIPFQVRFNVGISSWSQVFIYTVPWCSRLFLAMADLVSECCNTTLSENVLGLGNCDWLTTLLRGWATKCFTPQVILGQVGNCAMIWVFPQMWQQTPATWHYRCLDEISRAWPRCTGSWDWFSSWRRGSAEWCFFSFLHQQFIKTNNKVSERLWWWMAFSTH